MKLITKYQEPAQGITQENYEKLLQAYNLRRKLS